MKEYWRYLLVLPLLLVCLLVGMLAGVGLDRVALQEAPPIALPGITPESSSSAPGATPASSMPDLQLLMEAWRLIDAHYVDRQAVESQRLTYGAISGMVAALGDTGHSTFMTPEMLRSAQIDLSGEFEGIGAYVEMKDGYVTIVTPMDGSPAQEAGLKPGDVVIKVDGQDMTGKSLDEVISHIMGPAGTQVTLTIVRPSTQETFDVTITRAHITIHSVTWSFMPGTHIAHVRVASFSQNATDELKQALNDAQQQGATGIILDLRNNPGGLLDQAVSSASQFLADGNVLLERDAQGNDTPIPVEPGGVATDIPMVVLINGGTASGAEIVAGAIQDAGRAQLVGETTFGTGTVLSQFDLSDGSALLLATQEWLTPKGRLIWHQGIAPDKEVKLPLNANMLLPEAESGMTPQQLQASEDVQLLAALDLLLQALGAGGTG